MNLRSFTVGLGLALAVPGLLLLPAPAAQAQRAKAGATSKAKKARCSKIAEREAAALEEAKNKGPSKKVKRPRRSTPR